VFNVGKLFHLAHLVDDLDAVDRWYDEIFSCVRFYRAYEKAAQREASLLVISDMLMEPIMPSAAPEAANSPLRKFQARFGNRLHSIAWYVDDIKACSADFAAKGIRQVGLTGKPVTDPAKAVAIWTHPKDTHALLEFCEAGFAPDPRLQADWSDQPWRDHPLRIEHSSHITCLFESVDDAAATYGEALGGTLVETRDGPDALRHFYAVGDGTVVEAVQPLQADSPEGKDLAANGEGVFGLAFRTSDLDGAARFLEEKGQRVVERTGDSFRVELDPGFGLRLTFTDRVIGATSS
jgi:catechol 2,3-dioxygenase-like lactoylglutathione lyase family enzyme